MRLCGIGAGLNFEGSVGELQVGFPQDRHFNRGPSLCRSPTDAP